MLFDAVVGGATSVKNGINKGTAKHLMTQGINATDNIAEKGLKKSYKYYISQTNEVFYKPLRKDAIRDLLYTPIRVGAEIIVKRGLFGYASS